MDASHRIIRIVVVCAAALWASASLVAQDSALRVRFTKGEVERYRSVTQTDMVMSGLPGMGDMNVTTTMTNVFKMVADTVAADGTGTLKVTYESMKMAMSIPMMGDVTYDTAAPPPDGNPITDAFKPLNSLVGQEFTMVMSALGKIQKVDGLKPILDKVKTQADAGSGGAAGMPGGNNLQAFLSEDAQVQMLQQGFPPFPDKPVKVGDTWEHSYKAPNPMGNQLIAYKYTLKDVTAGVARIASAGTVKPDGPPAPMGPMTVTMGDGTAQGETLFDTKLGRARKTVVTMSIPLSMVMSAPDGTNLNVQAASKSTTTIELIEK